MRIAVVGTGYVGLVTGAGLADFGNEVTCVDVDEAKIEALNRGRIPIYEPGLEPIVNRNMGEDRLRFTTDLEGALETAKVIFIAVGTPPKEDGSANLAYVEEVGRAIGQGVSGFVVVVTKSTVPVGTGRRMRGILDEYSGTSEIAIVSNPEFLREGSAVEDFLRPDRVVLGSDSESAIQLMKQVYQPLHSLEVPFVVTDLESAELIKYASNAFLATKISFINEIALLCERLGADVQSVAKGMGLDHRIGPRFLQAGPGFGGSCFPKDTSAIVDTASKVGCRFQIVESVLDVNEAVKDRMIEKVAEAIGGSLSGRRVAILGLSFKPETDDMRDSPALTLVGGLVERGASVRAYDPVAMANARQLLPEIEYAEDAYEACDRADVAVIVTEWNEFRALDFEYLDSVMERNILVDLRNIYEPKTVTERGFQYYSIGRATALPDRAIRGSTNAARMG